jgi:prolyl-tRNA editing enzyme YbaK/EbsC (Cys-tRNA(Pro) deacylase)
MAWKQIDVLHPNGVKVLDALRTAGVPTDIVETLEGSPTAATAAAQLDIEVGQVCNSLLFNADGEPLLILASGGNKVDVDRVATELGFDSIHRPDADFVREHTGQPIGGVAPLGHPSPVRTIVDTHLSTWEVVWAAGGHPHYVFPTSFDELVRITGGEPLDVGVR